MKAHCFGMAMAEMVGDVVMLSVVMVMVRAHIEFFALNNVIARRIGGVECQCLRTRLLWERMQKNSKQKIDLVSMIRP